MKMSLYTHGLFILVVFSSLTDTVLGYIPYVDFATYELLTQSKMGALFSIEGLAQVSGKSFLDLVFNSKALKDTACGEQLEVTIRCKDEKHSSEQEAKLHKMRSFQIIDSWGKVPAGIIEGNVNWLGRPRMCQHIYQVSKPNGTSQSFRFVSSIVQFQLAGGTLTNTLTTPINQGFCLPESCTSAHLIKLFNVSRPNFQLEPRNVYFQKNGSYGAAFIVVLFVLTIFFLLVIGGTTIDVGIRWYIHKMNKQIRAEDRAETIPDESLVSAFSDQFPNSTLREVPEILADIDIRIWVNVIRCWSLYTNMGAPHIGRRRRRFKCIEGIKVLSLWWTILGHTVVYFVLCDPVAQLDNLEYAYRSLRTTFVFTICLHATFAVDTLLVISGFLMAYVLLERLEMRTGRINGKFCLWYYFRRYIRQTVVILIIVLVTCGIWDVLGNDSGPQWQPGLNQVENCRQNWWSLLLYIQNFFHTSNPCLGWTWFSAVDFQLFCIFPPLVYLAYRNPNVAIVVLYCLMGLCMFITMILTVVFDLPPGATSPFMNNQIYKQFEGSSQYYNIIYNKPYFRFPSYACGVILGIELFTNPLSYKKVPRVAVMCSWLLALLLQITCLFCTRGLFFGDFPGRAGAAIYNGIIPVLWSLTIFWIIWACCQGYGGPVNTLLSAGFWKPLSRQSFMVYLVNCLVIQFHYTTSEDNFHLTAWNLFYYFIANLALSHLITTVFTFLFDFPFGRIDKMITNRLDQDAIDELNQREEQDQENQGGEEDADDKTSRMEYGKEDAVSNFEHPTLCPRQTIEAIEMPATPTDTKRLQRKSEEQSSSKNICFFNPIL